MKLINDVILGDTETKTLAFLESRKDEVKGYECGCGYICKAYVEHTWQIRCTNRKGFQMKFVVDHNVRDMCEECGTNDEDLSLCGDDFKLGYFTDYFHFKAFTPEGVVEGCLADEISYSKTEEEIRDKIKKLIEEAGICSSCNKMRRISDSGICGQCTNFQFLFGIKLTQLDLCSICREDIHECDLHTTSCLHHFHRACIYKVKGEICGCHDQIKEIKCPLCRKKEKLAR